MAGRCAPSAKLVESGHTDALLGPVVEDKILVQQRRRVKGQKALLEERVTQLAQTK